MCITPSLFCTIDIVKVFLRRNNFLFKHHKLYLAKNHVRNKQLLEQIRSVLWLCKVLVTTAPNNK